MPISYDGQVYENDYDLEMGRPMEQPEEPSTGASGRPRVYIRPDDNNAPAGNVEARRGIVDDTSQLLPVPQEEAPKTELVSPPIIGDGGQFSAGTQVGNAFVQRNEDVLKGVVHSVIQGVLAPGDALQGKLPMWAVDPETGEVNTSPEVIQRTQDLAQFAVLGPAPIASKMADGTLGSFMGVRSKTFNKNELGGAQVMEANAVHPDEIFNKTGTFRDVDNHWKQEIADNKSELNANWTRIPSNNPGTPFTGKLTDVLDHPELYKAYPQLKDVKVVYNPKQKGAFYDKNTKEIHTGPGYVDKKEMYLHETQHAIQDIEGFATGGSPVKNPKLRFEKDIEKLRDEGKGLVEDWKAGKDFSSEKRERIKYIDKVLKLDILRKHAAVRKAEENYMNLAGEAESRNVEYRMLLDSSNNRRYPPWYSEDTPKHQQTVVTEPVWATPYGYSRNPNEVPK